MAERVKPILLTMEDGTEYTLEYNRQAIAKAERNGFTVADLDTKMMVRVPELFFYAFYMHHPNLTKVQTDKILFEEMGGISDEIIKRLGELYAQGYESLVNSDPKNSKVTITL